MLEQKSTFHSQHLRLAKLPGFDFEIVYKRGKENVVADALQDILMEGCLLSTTFPEQIKASVNKDTRLKKIMQDIQQDPNSHHRYQRVNGHLKRKDKVVIGDDPALQSQGSPESNGADS